jgi:hypothetical protein
MIVSSVRLAGEGVAGSNLTENVAGAGLAEGGSLHVAAHEVGEARGVDIEPSPRAAQPEHRG